MLLFRIPSLFLVVAGLLTSVNALPVPQVDIGTDDTPIITSQANANIPTDGPPEDTSLAVPHIRTEGAVNGVPVAQNSSILNVNGGDCSSNAANDIQPATAAEAPSVNPRQINDTSGGQAAGASSNSTLQADGNGDAASDDSPAGRQQPANATDPLNGASGDQAAGASSNSTLQAGGAGGDNSTTNTQPANATDAPSDDPPQANDVDGQRGSSL